MHQIAILMSLLQRDEHTGRCRTSRLYSVLDPVAFNLRTEAGRLNAYAEETQRETGRKAIIGAAPLDPSRNQVCAILEKESSP
jgi:hypothetical protein